MKPFQLMSFGNDWDEQLTLYDKTRGQTGRWLSQSKQSSLIPSNLIIDEPVLGRDNISCRCAAYFSNASACFRAASLWPPSIRVSSVTRSFWLSNAISEIVRPSFTCLVTT